MSWIIDVWPIFAAVIAVMSGGVTWLWRRHMKKVKEHGRLHGLIEERLDGIEDRLGMGDRNFRQNTSEHAQILANQDKQTMKLVEAEARLAHVYTALCELLVQGGLRRPGEGINGEKRD